MDTTKEKLAQEQLDELKTALKEYTSSTPTLSSEDTSSWTYNASDTITLSSLFNSPSSNTTIGSGIYNNGVYTVTGQGFPPTFTSHPYQPSGKIKLDGPDADIEVNGVSLIKLLEQRLNILIPNPELEVEWNELKELGDQYRALEKKLKEQSDMWAKLKSMPPPDLE